MGILGGNNAQPLPEPHRCGAISALTSVSNGWVTIFGTPFSQEEVFGSFVLFS